MPTAALVVIGDEVLRGKVRDENSPWLALRLREIGIDLLRITTIPDELPVIAAAVAEASALADHAFTSGGVGPTHDDKTMEGVALAFGVPLQTHPDLDRVLAAKMGEHYNDAARQMARIPTGAELWWDGDIFFPQVMMRNVCILPGVPSLFRRKFDAVAWRYSGVPMGARRIVTLASETEIAHHLTEAQARWPSVSIGSYPQFDTRPWTVTITLDSRDGAALLACEAALRLHLGPEPSPSGGAPAQRTS